MDNVILIMHTLIAVGFGVVLGMYVAEYRFHKRLPQYISKPKMYALWIVLFYFAIQIASLIWYVRYAR